MQMYEESNKNTKVNKILITSIFATIIIIIILLVTIIYISRNTVQRVAIIDDKKNDILFELMEYEKDNDGKEYIVFPIKEIAQYLGYKAYNGEYKSATEDKNKCYVIAENKGDNSSTQTEGKEAANFELNSNVISKIDLTSKSNEYEYYELDKKVIQKNGKLYTTVDGIQKAFNAYFDYDTEKQKITVYTLEHLNEIYTKRISDGEYKGYKTLATKSLKNEKALLENMLIVQAENDKYGVIDARRKKSNIRGKI